jgi:hypothetical protein
MSAEAEHPPSRCRREEANFGDLPEKPSLIAGLAAEGRVSVASRQIADDDLAAIGKELIGASAYVFGRNSRNGTWSTYRDSLRGIRDRVGARARALERG